MNHFPSCCTSIRIRDKAFTWFPQEKRSKLQGAASLLSVPHPGSSVKYRLPNLNPGSSVEYRLHSPNSVCGAKYRFHWILSKNCRPRSFLTRKIICIYRKQGILPAKKQRT